MSAVSAIAHPNIALAKYWGKRQGEGNYPAVPSLSITLAGMETRTRVRFQEGLHRDRFVLDGQEELGRPRERVVAMLERVRELSGLRMFAEVESKNDFPTASGLASSASGFAALAVAALEAGGIGAPSEHARERASDLARRASVSAARSVYGGFVELAAGPVAPARDERLVARQLPVPDAFRDGFRVLVAVATEAKKDVSSTDGMGRTARESPYYGAWLDEAPRLCARLREAALAGDFDTVGALAESSCLAMHACAMAAGIVYWNAVTVDLMAAVRELRAGGTRVYFTIDAGPHVKVLAEAADVPVATARLRAVPGTVRVIETRAGGGAALESGPHEASGGAR